MDKAQKIHELIGPSLEQLGFDLVRVRLMGKEEMPALQIMAEHTDGTGINLGDCQTISQTISAILDVEDPLEDAYHLEVSSPGIDRPLTRLKDFERFKGFDAKIEAPLLIEGRKRFQGKILNIKDEMIEIEAPSNETFEIPFDAIQKAKLVLTDDLINAVTNKEV